MCLHGRVVAPSHVQGTGGGECVVLFFINKEADIGVTAVGLQKIGDLRFFSVQEDDRCIRRIMAVFHAGGKRLELARDLFGDDAVDADVFFSEQITEVLIGNAARTEHDHIVSL